jgi:antitoxin ParD1/3/4
MNVTLPPEWEQFISRKIESGQYAWESEVVLEGLRLLRERDELEKMRLEVLRQEIAIGIEQADRGELVDSEIAFARLRQKIEQASGQSS